MKILLCKPKYIGDTLLLTGVAREIIKQAPSAEIHVAVREGTEGILAGSPDIAKIHTLAKPKEHGRKSPGLVRDLRVIRDLRRERFDHVFELSGGDRGRFVAALCGAKHRHANPFLFRSAIWKLFFSGEKFDDTRMRQIDRDTAPVATALGFHPGKPLPVFVRERADFSFTQTSARPTLFAHPTASVAENMWPEARWTDLIAELARDADIILSCGPAPTEIARCERILAGLPDPSRVKFTRGALNWAQMADCLHSSSAYIGADTAALHLASACGTPIVGIFGRNSPDHLARWSPGGARERIVTFSRDESGIADIPVRRVLDALGELRAKTPSTT